MQNPDDIRRDLPPDLSRSETDPLVALALWLQTHAPVPAPTFRGVLRRELLGAERQRVVAITPSVARILAASYVTSGLLLLAIAAAGLVGSGPFAFS